MAGRLIVMKNATDQIKGNCEAENYTEWLKLEGVSFAVGAALTPGEDTGSVHQSSITMHVPFGPWVAELQQRLFHGKELGDVEIVEIAQSADAEKKKTWKKVRELKLVQGWVESVSHGWTGISQSVAVSLQYTDITFTWGDKVAHYNRSEKS